MNCQDFKDQFEVDSDLNQTAREHLKGCETCQLFESEENRLTQMFKGLKRVESPKDFGFRLNAYIAQTEKVKRPLPRLWQILRFSMPLAAAGLILGFVVINSNLLTDSAPDLAGNINKFELREEKDIEASEPIKPLPATKNTPPDLLMTETRGPSANTEAGSIMPDQREVVLVPTPEKKPEFVKPVARRPMTAKNVRNIIKTPRRADLPIEEKDFSGSRNSAATQPKVITLQNTNQNNIDQGMQPNGKFIRKRDRLSEVGISTAKGVWKVTAVKKGSTAERSGVAVGDILIELNGRPITEKMPKPWPIKTLRVLRKGKVLKFNLVN